MFFKCLELFGFKSFAQKTVLDFEAGVTAIVGPNGCGKSNISDSIKWVLGEQSVRSMRGSIMEDVIFHGADDLPPVGFAEVSLTVSNQNKLLPLEYEEVTITRRIYRSGESEYLLNKVPVRLKDISELLMGTGMGMSSYSLMEQGNVDQILSSRPEERRAIFEEAAGITKYKSKKEEALRKLERTGENLQRLGDIIVEVKRQIKSMERQVSRAQRYKEEFEKLKEYELKVAQNQLHSFRKEQTQLMAKVQEQKSEEAAFCSKMNSLVAALETTKQDLSQAEEGLAQIQAKSYELSAAINTTEGKVALDKERIEELTGSAQANTQKIEELAKKIAAVTEQVNLAQEELKSIEQRKQEKTSFLTEQKENIQHILEDIETAQREMAKDKAEEVEAIAQQSRTKNDLTKLQANSANLNARLRRLNLELTRTKEELDNIEGKRQLCTKAQEELNGQLRQLIKEIWDVKSNHNVELEKKNKLDGQIEEYKRKISALQSKINFLQELTRNYEGFSRGVKAILSARDTGELKLSGHYGAVANLIKVAPEYQIVIEMALADFAQALVVENESCALEAISYLKTKEAGRASFICLDSLAAGQSRPGSLTKQNLTRAFDLVQVEPKFQRLIEYLLGETFIAQDRDSAQHVLKNLNSPGGRLVTLDGEILTKATINGGSSPGNTDTSLLGRQERLSRNIAELEQSKQEQVGLENLKAAQEQRLKELTSQIEQKEPQLNQLKIKLANKESEGANIEAEKNRLQDELSVSSLELGETTEEVEQLETQQAKLNQELGKVQKKEEQLKQGIQLQQNIITEKEQSRQDMFVEVAQTQTSLLALDKELESAHVRLTMLMESAGEHKQAQQASQQDAQVIAAKSKQLKLELVQLQSQAKELSQAKLSVEEKLQQGIEVRQKLSTALKDMEDKIKATQKILDEVRAKSASLQVRLTELNYKQDSLNDKMRQSYQIDLTVSLSDDADIPVPDESVFQEIEQLKSRLQGLGPVNLVAIEENEQLQQRHSFLVSQQQDLINAQESLRKAIVQINRTARELFSDIFQKIQANFKEYFRILFNGGDARLILLDENNTLESGIEIVVRPPGKKLQNISLLSGGEKALTAIALLFAIFKVKPSPFCILDEVDAPLDESNVDRFTNLLSEFIKTSQFIIITHNKKTINMADVMYGITMEKSGVSKIVSVRFTDEQELAAAEVAQVES